MKSLRYAVALAGALGIAALFMRYWSGLEGSMWDYRKIEPLAVYLPLGGFGLGVLSGGLATLTGGMARWHAVLGLVGFAASMASEWVHRGWIGDAGFKPAIGGKLLFVSAVAGLALALVGVLRPHRR
jgi:hypothetical protein